MQWMWMYKHVNFSSQPFLCFSNKPQALPSAFQLQSEAREIYRVHNNHNYKSMCLNLDISHTIHENTLRCWSLKHEIHLTFPEESHHEKNIFILGTNVFYKVYTYEGWHKTTVLFIIFFVVFST
jgi:hypothetical protein